MRIAGIDGPLIVAGGENDTGAAGEKGLGEGIGALAVQVEVEEAGVDRRIPLNQAERTLT